MGDKPVIWIVGMNFNDSEKEEEFNEWYNNVHVPEVLTAPGVVSANRYFAEGSSQGLPKYIAIYELESEDAIKKAMSSKEMSSAIMDFTKSWGKFSSDLSTVIYKHIGP